MKETKTRNLIALFAALLIALYIAPYMFNSTVTYNREIPHSESIGIADSVTVIKNPDAKQNFTDDPTNFAPQNPVKPAKTVPKQTQSITFAVS